MKKIYVGIDFAKEKFDAAVISSDGSVGSKHSSFKNDTRGIKAFTSWVEESGGHVADTLLCGENMGIYSQLLSDSLHAGGWTMWLESALQIKRSMGIQRIKTDKADAFAIAEYAMRFRDRAIAYEPLKESLRSLREIFMYRAHLVEQKKALDTRIGEKSSTDSKAGKALRFMQESTEMIVRRLEKEIRKCEVMMEEIIRRDGDLYEVFCIVTSIKGIGLQNAVALMVYTNNFTRFGNDARRLACYWGVAPFGRQSGTSLDTPPHTSPMALKPLKALLTQAALCATVHCPELRRYYDRLIARGKKPMVALNNVKNKLLHIITAMVRDRKKYDSGRYMEIAGQFPKAATVLN